MYLEGAGSQQMAYIVSCMLSATVASPGQTLRELLAGHHEYINPYKQPSPSISSIARAQFAEGFSC